MYIYPPIKKETTPSIHNFHPTDNLIKTVATHIPSKMNATIIATIPVGYADGVDRHLSCGKGYFTVNGHRVPTIGNVCMDMSMLDITGVPAQVGDTVTIFGEDPTISELAAVLDTIPYEIITSVPRRIKRVIVR